MQDKSLLLFQDVYCDYQLVANHLYNFMKRKYRDSFYLAVSRKFEGCECLPEILEQLEQQMEEKFYHPEKHVFSNEDDVLKLSVGEVQDSQIMQMISEDITRKDTDQLRKHFACLKEKYHDIKFKNARSVRRILRAFPRMHSGKYKESMDDLREYFKKAYFKKKK